MLLVDCRLIYGEMQLMIIDIVMWHFGILMLQFTERKTVMMHLVVMYRGVFVDCCGWRSSPSSTEACPSHILPKPDKTCMVISNNMGRLSDLVTVKRLVLYLNLPKPDKWDSSQLIAFPNPHQVQKSRQLKWCGAPMAVIDVWLSSRSSLCPSRYSIFHCGCDICLMSPSGDR